MINRAPADLGKEGATYGLSIAMEILEASDNIYHDFVQIKS